MWLNGVHKYTLLFSGVSWKSVECWDLPDSIFVSENTVSKLIYRYVGIVQMKSKAELPSTDVLVNL